MSTVDIGARTPDFSLIADNGQMVHLSDYQGRWLIVYFYPKDDTPGCTTEAIDFTQNLNEFKALNADIVGISADDNIKHQKFKAKHNLNITLLSDETHDTLSTYGVWVEKNMYGRRYMGIERATFLIDDKAIIRKIWRKVKVKGHVEDILQTLNSLQ